MKMLRLLIKWSSLCILLIAIRPLSAKPKIITSTTILADFTQQIAQEYAIVESIVPENSDPHLYEITPSDVKKIKDADLIIVNGLHLEGWLDKVITQSKTQAPKLVATQGIKAIKSGTFDQAYDPHAWMCVRNAQVYTANIANFLQKNLPEHASHFAQNSHKYQQKLQALDEEIKGKMAKIPEEKRWLITTHDAFSYFANSYQISVFTLLGTSTDADIQVGDVRQLIQLIEAQQIPAIFVEQAIQPKIFTSIARDVKITLSPPLYADALGGKNSKASNYIDMMQYNSSIIQQGLTAGFSDNQEILYAQARQELWWLMLIVISTFIIGFWVLSKRLFPFKKEEKADAYAIDVEHLHVSYGRKIVLVNTNLKLESGKIYGLIGPNGSGKSTLLKSLLGLIPIDSGTISINGKPPKGYRHKIAYVPQKDEIDWQFPATVNDIVYMGRSPHRSIFSLFNEADEKVVKKSIKQLEIDKLRHQKIGSLSGGQQQRVFIARALAQEADIYILDEPFVGVDVMTEEKIMFILKKLAARGKLILVIHHDLSKVKAYFDEIIMLNQRLIAFGPTAEVFNDHNIKKTFGGRLKVLQNVEGFVEE